MRRRLVGVAVLLLVSTGVLLAEPALAAPSAAPTGGCSGVVGFVTCNPLVEGVTGLATGNPLPVLHAGVQIGGAVVGSWARGKVGNAMSDTIAGTALGVLREIASPTMPKTFPEWFMEAWRSSKSLAFQVLFLCYVISIIAGVLKANLARVAQSPMLAAAVVGAITVALLVASVAVQVVDWMSLQALGGSLGNVATVIETFGAVTNVSAVAGANVIVGFCVTLLVLVSFGIIWLNLMIRKWVIFLAVGLVGLALSSSLTKTGARWCKFLVGLLGAIVLSKFVLVEILVSGIAALAKPSSISDVAGGGIVLLCCGLSPFLLVGLVWAGSLHALHGGREALGEPWRKAKSAGRSAHRIHNHWNSASSKVQRRQAKKQAAASAAAKRAQAASKKLGAQLGAAAKAAKGTAGGAVTAGATATAAAARRAKRAVAGAASKVTGTAPPPPGYSATPSGLLVPASSRTPPASAPPLATAQSQPAAMTLHTCGGPVFGRLTPGCPRCEELGAGAPTRQWIRPRN